MALNDRLARLERAEAARGPQRCVDCRDWPDTLILDEYPDGTSRYEAPADWTGPQACSSCGFRPRLVVVKFPAVSAEDEVS